MVCTGGAVVLPPLCDGAFKPVCGIENFLAVMASFFSIERSQSSASNGSEELENVGGRVLMNSANLD